MRVQNSDLALWADGEPTSQVLGGVEREGMQDEQGQSKVIHPVALLCQRNVGLVRLVHLTKHPAAHATKFDLSSFAILLMPSRMSCVSCDCFRLNSPHAKAQGNSEQSSMCYNLACVCNWTELTALEKSLQASLPACDTGILQVHPDLMAAAWPCFQRSDFGLQTHFCQNKEKEKGIEFVVPTKVSVYNC